MLLQTANSLLEAVQEGNKSKAPPLGMPDILDFLRTHNLDIFVGTGSHGSRIFINPKELWMGADELYGRQLRKKFYSLFGLANIGPDSEFRIQY